MRKFVLLLLLVTTLQPCIFAQDIHFTTVDPPKENQWSPVNSMTQDPQGYLWMTSSGLYKFDGKTYTFYQHEPNNANSLALDNVASVFAA